MTKSRQPNEIKNKPVTNKENETVLHNAVKGRGVSVFLKKKRYYGGLMCPPMGTMPSIAELAEKAK